MFVRGTTIFLLVLADQGATATASAIHQSDLLPDLAGDVAATADDIMEFDPDSNPMDQHLFLERFIHGETKSVTLAARRICW